jgi:ParB/RepB/Spo0J family partition protein
LTAAIAEVPRKKSDVETRHAASPPTLYAPSQSTVYEIPVDLIVRSETNRQPELDDDFVESISRGVDSPVLVRAIKATQEHVTALKEEHWRLIDSPDVSVGQTIYKLVYGERRWAASKKAGNKTIPAIVRELTETQALEIQVRENEQRKDYNALDRSAAYAHLRAQYMKDHHGEKGFTEEKCCALIADTCKNDKIKGRTVQQIIALGKLSGECQEALRKGEMEQSHAYEFSRLSAQDQAELLLWLRQQTHHSQGDIPSVRRLKLEIRKMEEQREAEKRQPLFQETEKKESGVGAKLTFDGKTIELALGPLPGSVRVALCKTYPNLTTSHFLRDGRVQLAQGLTGDAFYLTVPELQKVLTSGKSTGSAQTSAATPADKRTAAAIANYKPPTKAQLAAAEKQREAEARSRRDYEQREKIQKVYTSSLFAAMAKKARINSRLLTHVVPNLLFEVWENEWPIDSFGQQVLGWPAPADQSGYSYNEVREYCDKHTRKFTPGVLASLLVALFASNNEQLARYFGVDLNKLRQKAAAQVKQEDADAKKKAKGLKLKAGAKA